MTPNSEKELENTILQVVKEENPASVRELALSVRQKLQISESKIMNSIMKLEAEDRLKLTKNGKALGTMSSFLMTDHAAWYDATLALVAATLFVALAIPEGMYPWVYARYVIGAISVLWLPGYSFMRALFPSGKFSKSSKELDSIERTALSLGMSLAIVPIVGLLLNYTAWGIRIVPILLSLSSLTVVFATIALIREYRNLKASAK